MTERLHSYFSLSCIGEGNGNPLQCSCLENPRDRGAWWLPSMGSHRVRYDWSDLAAAAAAAYFVLGIVKLSLSSIVTTAFNNSMWIQVYEWLFNVSSLCLNGSEGENHEWVTGAYFFLTPSCTEATISLNQWSPWSGTFVPTWSRKGHKVQLCSSFSLPL